MTHHGPPQYPPPSSPGPHLVRIDPVPGTPFGVAYVAVHATLSGLAVASMVVGLGACLAAFAVLALGMMAAANHQGVLVAGAFAILAILASAAAAISGIIARGQIAQAAGRWSGRGLAATGIICAIAAFVLTLLGFMIAAVLD